MRLLPTLASGYPRGNHSHGRLARFDESPVDERPVGGRLRVVVPAGAAALRVGHQPGFVYLVAGVSRCAVLRVPVLGVALSRAPDVVLLEPQVAAVVVAGGCGFSAAVGPARRGLYRAAAGLVFV